MTEAEQRLQIWATIIASNMAKSLNDARQESVAVWGFVRGMTNGPFGPEIGQTRVELRQHDPYAPTGSGKAMG